MRKVAFSILVDNSFAVITRICSLFVRRGYNIESFSVGVTEDTDTTRMTIVATGEEDIIDQLSKQVNKLADVIDVFELTDNKSIFRELVLIKVEVTKENIDRINKNKAHILELKEKLVKTEQNKEYEQKLLIYVRKLRNQLLLLHKC